jgi:hypothetical protein
MFNPGRDRPPDLLEYESAAVFLKTIMVPIILILRVKLLAEMVEE